MESDPQGALKEMYLLEDMGHGNNMLDFPSVLGHGLGEMTLKLDFSYLHITPFSGARSCTNVA